MSLFKSWILLFTTRQATKGKMINCMTRASAFGPSCSACSCCRCTLERTCITPRRGKRTGGLPHRWRLLHVYKGWTRWSTCSACPHASKYHNTPAQSTQWQKHQTYPTVRGAGHRQYLTSCEHYIIPLIQDSHARSCSISQALLIWGRCLTVF